MHMDLAVTQSPNRGRESRTPSFLVIGARIHVYHKKISHVFSQNSRGEWTHCLLTVVVHLNLWPNIGLNKVKPNPQDSLLPFSEITTGQGKTTLNETQYFIHKRYTSVSFFQRMVNLRGLICSEINSRSSFCESVQQTDVNGSKMSSSLPCWMVSSASVFRCPLLQPKVQGSLSISATP